LLVLVVLEIRLAPPKAMVILETIPHSIRLQQLEADTAAQQIVALIETPAVVALAVVVVFSTSPKTLVVLVLLVKVTLVARAWAVCMAAAAAAVRVGQDQITWRMETVIKAVRVEPEQVLR
jgi:hypothetical protein